MDDFLESTPIVFFLFVLAIVIGPMIIRTLYQNRERQRLHETLRLMVEKGQPVSGELLETLNAPLRARPPCGPSSDMRRGVVLLAIALGIAGLGIALGVTIAEPAEGPLIGCAAFPGFLGLGFIVLGLVGRDRTRP